jgi:hypothetical protein
VLHSRKSLERHGLAIVLPFGLLMLAMAVFAWGLQYKLSLYKSNTIAHTAPEAKLLSEKERPLAAQALDTQAPQLPALPLAPALMVLAMALAFDPAMGYFRSYDAQRVQIPQPACLRRIFYRPPPTR